MHDGRAEPVEVVDRLADALFVAGDRRRADHDRVARVDLHARMVAHRHARERRHRLALRARRDDHDLVRRVFVDLLEPDHPLLRNVQVAELRRIVHHVRERAAEERDAAAEADRLIHDLLDARHVRRERRDDDAPRRAREDVRERFADDALRRRVPGTFRVRRVREHAEHAFIADARDRREIGRAAVDRRLVELEIARVEDRSEFGRDRERTTAGEAVVDVDELGLDAAVLDDVAGLHGDEVAIADLLILELRANERERERRAHDRNVELAQQIRDAADVIFVPVGHEQGAKLVLVFAQVREVVDHDVDAEHLVVGKHQTAIDHDDVVAGLDHGHVAADFPAPAEGDDPDVGLARRLCDDEFHRRLRAPIAITMIQKSLSGSAAPCRGQSCA